MTRAAALLAALAALLAGPDVPPRDPVVEVTLGAPEVVMDWSSDSCRASDGLDLPDVQARALRRSDGSLLLVSGNAPDNYAMFGPSFDLLQRRCVPILTSTDQPTPLSIGTSWWATGRIQSATVSSAARSSPSPAICSSGLRRSC